MLIKGLVSLVMTVEVEGEVDDPENMMIIDYENPDINDVYDGEVLEVLEVIDTD